MDRHDSLDATAKAIAEAHQLDIKIQSNYGCKALTYWFDEDKKIAFCLIDAPDKKSVEEMHRNSHGLVPNQIIEVQSNIVEYFLGRISDPVSTKKSIQFISETAFRAILYIDCMYLKNNSANNTNNESGLRNVFNNLIRPALKEYDGVEVKIKNEGFMASFTSVSKAVNCAIKIQTGIKELIKTSGNKIIASIGLSTGYPVTDADDLFGETILLAKRLCEIANDGELVISSSVTDFYEVTEINSHNNTIKIISAAEEKFLNLLMELTEQVWNDEEFSVVNFSKKIGLSKAQLYRKLISLTGNSPNEFIKEYRLKKALKLLDKKHRNISEIAYDTGFSNPSYFSKCFQKEYGILPSEYVNSFI
jgi:AraC-like DNA-binding protein